MGRGRRRAAWVGAIVWLARDSLASMPPLALAQFGATLATVPALAGIVWLAALRTSRTEAQRFGATARQMRAEAAALGHTVTALGHAIEELLRACARDGDPAYRAALDAAVLAFSIRQSRRSRSWFRDAGFDHNPAELPELADMVAGEQE